MATKRNDESFINKPTMKKLLFIVGFILLSGCATDDSLRGRVGPDYFCRPSRFGSYGQEIRLDVYYLDCYVKICGHDRSGCSADRLREADECMRSMGFKINNECP
jgi:hypothetical protein